MIRRVLLPFFCLACTKSMAQNKLHITVTNLEKTGTVYIAIYNKPDYFGNPRKAMRKIISNPEKSSLTATAENLPEGDYAIAVYQDINDNKKIDKNLLGIPTEPFAFSNNVRPIVSAPTFKQCKVSLAKPEQSISIKLMNYL